MTFSYTLTKLARKISTNRQQLGNWNTLLFFVARLLHALSGGHIRYIRYHLVAQPTHCAATDQPLRPARPGSGSDIRYRELSELDLTALPRPADIIRQRFQRGHRCLVAQSKGQFAGYLWLASGHYDEDEVRCRYLLPDAVPSAWDYDVYVAPAFRIGRTFARLWQEANRSLAEAGVSWCYSRISAFNPESLHAHLRLGSTRLFSANFITLGPWQLMLAGAAPWLHLSLSRTSRPVLRLTSPIAGTRLS